MKSLDKIALYVASLLGMYYGYGELSFSYRCKSADKIFSQNPNELATLIELLSAVPTDRDPSAADRIFRERGYSIDYDGSTPGYGISERPISILKDGQRIAVVYNVLLNRFNPMSFLGGYDRPIDRNCAFGAAGGTIRHYPDF